MTAIRLAPRVESSRRARRNAVNTWRTELLFLSMAGIELLWMTPWALIFMPGAVELTGPEVAAFLAAHFLSALVLMRLLIRRRAADGIIRVAFGISLIVALYITLHYILPLDTFGSQPPAFAEGSTFFSPALFTIAIVIWLWYRGQSLATATITPARAAFGLRVGIIALIAAGLIPDARIQRATLLLLPLFFCDGLAASSLARAATLRVQRDMQRSPFGIGWIGFVGLLSAVISLLGFGAALLLGGTSFDTILGVLGNVVAGILTVIASLLLPIAQAIAGLIDSLLTALSGRTSVLGQLGRNVQNAAGQVASPNQTLQQILANLPTACFGLIILLVFLALVVLLRGRKRAIQRGDEERESIGSSAILAGLKATLQRGLDAARDMLDTLSRFGLSGAVNAFTIRRLYRKLVGLATARGYPRGESQTPDEYRRLLYEAFPGFTTDIDNLTRAYVRAHYGELPDDPGIVVAARAALDQMAAQRST